MKKNINITFDGPAACGKSTVAKAVAKALGFLYVDTGAMYRAVAWLSIKKGISAVDTEALTLLAKNNPVTLVPAWDIPKGYRVIIDNTDITYDITLKEVNSIVSDVAAISGVRKILASQQHDMATEGGIVMAGRDITTVVMPDAELKIYLDASVDVRAKRRYLEEKEAGRDVSLEEIKKSLEMRDKLDSERADSPLMIADDAVVINSDDMTPDDVLNEVIKLAGEKTVK